MRSPSDENGAAPSTTIDEQSAVCIRQGGPSVLWCN